ncbi:hypothetical protein MNBD_CHLOROFLEXI01-4527 [hydrothermal vent metagenome]|uniref:HTH araC/xylS-type domain-containing protein n=1 Tax=hydrothermal vent metagenome TaxID=652676 RepID=A0A3B0VF78_9ZZZZ
MIEKQFTHLADIGFRRIAPSVALRPFVQWYWFIHSATHLPTQREEFMHPDGGSGLVFNWGDVLHMDSGRYPQTVTLDDVWRQSRRLQLCGTVNAFGIRFQPGGAYAVFGLPVHELGETACPELAEVAVSSTHHLYEQLFAAPATATKLSLIESWLMRQIYKTGGISPLIQPSLAIMGRTKGQVSIQKLADALHVSTRQLERLYKTQVGLSPKKLARIIRVRKAREALKQANKQSSAQVASANGFYDQSHFIREFKSVVGMTPVAYAKRRRDG